MELDFCRQIFLKMLKCQVSWRSSGSRNVPCGRTDTERHDEANSCFSQFCERA